MANRGPKPRGDRLSTSVTLPADHLAIYRREAAAAGLPFGDYVSIILARYRDLPIPTYLVDPARRLDHVLGGEPDQLMLGASA